ncbi:probable cell division control protein 7 homolog 2 [Neltuma alba]|uniref:probable cell division control protein 7 homolog 2 isoform X2 n=1 Tax=Neltuma alba TaxID=207710 RepID=UPI0010A30115|nr:probable cell division control protein 7 homolog 2 isoform X2 [Prosopis alba]XP_028772886.1 probable cell division control protein 7 homolog 2 [Prosopis alba]XP_028776404.1 probable cell division control protein 7 homolog 2 [Prosopis alba]
MDQQKLMDFLASKSYEEIKEVSKGAHGTVYKAKRKNSGGGATRVALKCIPLKQGPAAEAHEQRQRLAKEWEVLEQHGGKNYIINYKDRFKNGNTHCFVLQYIEHDKPEVLKEEISIDQLRRYGYCMFRALAALHEGGVIHTDVKPGSFLFSRKLKKGYLTDFYHARFPDENPVDGSPMPSKQPIANDAAGPGEQIRKGPWVGTRGYRAPEVLFRSPHQGPKLDIWSAGVSLLYLIMGKTPFTGDPEQSIKDIAQLRGSEDLWELAKLHNRESSFPADLYGKQGLSPLRFQVWFEKRMKIEKRGFLEVSRGFLEVSRDLRLLLDLLDKCLMVNPRLRIGAEEALKHEFFAPCR